MPTAPRGRLALVKPRHYLWIVGAALALFAALRWLGPVLTPFLVGAILAYLGRPIVAPLRGAAACPRTAGTAAGRAW